LLFLYAEKEPVKFERAALRWLARYATEGKAVSLLKRSSRCLPWQSYERVSSGRAGAGGEAAGRAGPEIAPRWRAGRPGPAFASRLKQVD
jgi:hypothetical protein